MNNKKGAITVYMSIVMMAIIILAGVLIDGARIRIAETQARRAATSSLRSLLAGYTREIKDNYGIFALNDNSPDELQDEFEDYLNKNLSPDIEPTQKNGIDLFDYRIEEVNITPIYNLSENEAAKHQILEYMKYRAPKQLVENFIEKINAIKDVSKTSEAVKRKTDLDGITDEYGKLKDELIGAIAETNKFDVSQVGDFYGLLDYIDKYTNLTKSALNIIDKMKEARQKVLAQLDVEEKYLDDNQKAANADQTTASPLRDGKVDSGFEKACKEDLDKIRKEVEKDDLDGIKSSLENNLRLLDAAMRRMLEYVNSKDKNKTMPDLNSITEEIKNGYKNDIRVDISIKPSEVKGKDPRKEAGEKAKEAVSDKTERVVISDEVFNALPSIYSSNIYPNKIYSKDYSEEDSKMGDGAKDSDFSGFIGNGDKIDLGGKTFSDGIFGVLTTLCNGIGNDLTTLRNQLYINEYIMGTFKNAVPQVEGNKDVDLRMREKSSNKSAFDACEIEYILHGNKNETTNLNLVKGQILLIRFGANSIYVYSNQEMLALADSIAISISAWNGGLSYLVIKNLILCGWSMAESVLDLNELMDGKSVPFLKDQTTWKTSIPGLSKAAAENSESKSKLSFNYYDYLRFFLLFSSENTKMNRTEDLIQLNMGQGFKVAEHNTYIRAEVTVSVKYMFMTQAFMPQKIKTKDSRHKISFVLYQGY